MKTNKKHVPPFKKFRNYALAFSLALSSGLTFGQVKYSFNVGNCGGYIGKDTTHTVNVGDTIEFVNDVADGKFRWDINGTVGSYGSGTPWILEGDTIMTFVLRDTTTIRSIQIWFKNFPSRYINLTLIYNSPSGVTQGFTNKSQFNCLVNNELVLNKNGNKQVTIQNTNGLFVKELFTTENKINISDIATGLYFVTLTDENKNVVRFKIVKE